MGDGPAHRARSRAACFALLHAFFAIQLRADQIVGGTAINFLALGVTGYFFIQVYGDDGTPGDLPRIPNVNIPGLQARARSSATSIGDLNLMIWLSFVLLIVAYVVIFKTPIGLRLRAVGEHPRAAETVGISVYSTRYAAVVALRHPRGARRRVPLDRLRRLVQREHDGRPRLHRARRPDLRQLAPVRRLRRRAPLRLLDARSRSALARRTPTSAAVLFQALPYVLTLIAVAGVIGRSIPPAAVGRPYAKQ